ncbi:F-box/FBD/LRR-repeat protein At4g26340-like [Lotus japonicus]|uniref:F-box/FBD/LRR-repeat protein At4g26340-like n=1 Tax=Lotus japonicus TaxID=34305 RepID=UPI00258929F4|nr:F-box/FBD/LRR-repeat protein At4g26340-like [Lotus japonicus]
MVDRISMLSDEVLCHILSFLSTEQAVATSVLSKRWKHLWISVSVLDYDDEIYLRNNRPHSCFERFVYATILPRDAQQPITRLRLIYGRYGSELSDTDVSHGRSNADIIVWVKTVIRRGIQNLDIQIHPQNYTISLSSCIFSCQTLVVLKLSGLSLNVSSSVELPSLKSLHLDLVKFVDPNYLMELLYGCPMLEDLKAEWIHYAVEEYDVKEEFKYLPKLVRVHLRFISMYDIEILLKAICNVEFLSIKQLRDVDEVPEFSHLRYLSLSLDIHSWHSVLLMLKSCPNLQSFKLNLRRSFEAVDVLPYTHFVVPECLTSHLKKCYLKYYRGTECDLRFAKYIMQSSTSLQSMKVLSVSPNSFEALKDLALFPRKSTSCTKLSVCIILCWFWFSLLPADLALLLSLLLAAFKASQSSSTPSSKGLGSMTWCVYSNILHFSGIELEECFG